MSATATPLESAAARDISERLNELHDAKDATERIRIAGKSSGTACCCAFRTNDYHTEFFLKPLTSEEINLPDAIPGEELMGTWRGQEVVLTGSGGGGCCSTHIGGIRTVAVAVTDHRLVVASDSQNDFTNNICCGCNDLFRSTGGGNTRIIPWHQVEGVRRVTNRHMANSGSCCGLCRTWTANTTVQVIISLRRPKSCFLSCISGIFDCFLPSNFNPYEIVLVIPGHESDAVLNAIFRNIKDYVYEPPTFRQPAYGKGELPTPKSELPRAAVIEFPAPKTSLMSR